MLVSNVEIYGVPACLVCNRVSDTAVSPFWCASNPRRCLRCSGLVTLLYPLYVCQKFSLMPSVFRTGHTFFQCLRCSGLVTRTVIKVTALHLSGGGVFQHPIAMVKLCEWNS